MQEMPDESGAIVSYNWIFLTVKNEKADTLSWRLWIETKDTSFAERFEDACQPYRR